MAASVKISDYITEDLRRRILGGDLQPDELGLKKIATYYDVSVMPVRAAVHTLVAEGTMLKLDNGRLAVPEGTPDSKLPEVEPPVDWQEIVLGDAVRESIQGKSTQWKIDDTADRYGIGRAVVQSIFHRLAGMGVLVHVPRRGWHLHPFCESDLDDYLRMRVLLEVDALDQTCRDLDPTVLQKMLDNNKPSQNGRPTKLDNDLHRYWIDRSENRYTIDFFERYGTYYNAIYRHALLSQEDLSVMARQHRAILEAILNQNWSTARNALSYDIESVRPLFIETLKRLSASNSE